MAPEENASLFTLKPKTFDYEYQISENVRQYDIISLTKSRSMPRNPLLNVNNFFFAILCKGNNSNLLELFPLEQVLFTSWIKYW